MKIVIKSGWYNERWYPHLETTAGILFFWDDTHNNSPPFSSHEKVAITAYCLQNLPWTLKISKNDQHRMRIQREKFYQAVSVWRWEDYIRIWEQTMDSPGDPSTMTKWIIHRHSRYCYEV